MSRRGAGDATTAQAPAGLGHSCHGHVNSSAFSPRCGAAFTLSHLHVRQEMYVVQLDEQECHGRSGELMKPALRR